VLYPQNGDLAVNIDYVTLLHPMYRGKWGQLTPPGKMDEKLKSENMQKEQFSEWGWGWPGEVIRVMTGWSS